MVGGEFFGVFVQNSSDHFLFTDKGEKNGLKCSSDIVAIHVVFGGHVKFGY